MLARGIRGDLAMLARRVLGARGGGYVLPGNNYHVYDYSLFWANVRADAQQRLAAFLKK